MEPIQKKTKMSHTIILFVAGAVGLLAYQNRPGAKDKAKADYLIEQCPQMSAAEISIVLADIAALKNDGRTPEDALLDVAEVCEAQPAKCFCAQAIFRAVYVPNAPLLK